MKALTTHGRDQKSVPRAQGGGNYGGRRYGVLLEAIEGALFVCPVSEKLIQHRLQKAWLAVADVVERDKIAVQRVTPSLFGEEA